MTETYGARSRLIDSARIDEAATAKRSVSEIARVRTCPECGEGHWRADLLDRCLSCELAARAARGVR